MDLEHLVFKLYVVTNSNIPKVIPNGIHEYHTRFGIFSFGVARLLLFHVFPTKNKKCRLFYWHLEIFILKYTLKKNYNLNYLLLFIIMD